MIMFVFIFYLNKHQAIDFHLSLYFSGLVAEAMLWQLKRLCGGWLEELKLRLALQPGFGLGLGKQTPLIVDT